ncbi:VOC family protein [Pelodictyon phaeoclathratiforme]|jgi:catechol-2,3-dioxygenase|uniref:Glyoxalase/bleomycin resistance protein/dioxygenase n=1 Tax=Pelodictyon phaeoclathratiforme (strain DSM 5477 / BU-1) TaxID=324925 RepID=B4SCF4_PELPB|nr:VOC family protein [Pelodictyon phaeoclathratiforme]ACF42734.1 Glyoxalase/bleomycin resistance protein/dioxygenase [Pelodictyon phaeoclathratiforme BU-1]MBV5288508.1 VOC family protein [Pelodictyon phaeoclathratiforme]
MMKLTGISQITLRVNDLRSAEEFYGGILGLKLDHRVGANITYLRINSDLLVLVKAETPGSPDARDIRVDHFGFRLASDAEVDAAALYLDECGVHMVTRPAHRREGRAFFVMDPDGNLVEFYSMHESGIQGESIKDIDLLAPDSFVTGTRKKTKKETEQQKPRRTRK